MAKVKVVTLFMVLLLLLFSTLTHAARPEPSFPNASPAKTQLTAKEDQMKSA
ncbi:hypothetical protein Patl1_11357 [Pistacia atlantica]|uniref:Uncharacterized protein n=1 Tax=Pistacia atlantica TaxID=434234 RepID=A0ACC1A7I0_9ROSI|nr:hypothetical protein Patl1_11357 [Pistacia atlantica]